MANIVTRPCRDDAHHRCPASELVCGCYCHHRGDSVHSRPSADDIVDVTPLGEFWLRHSIHDTLDQAKAIVAVKVNNYHKLDGSPIDFGSYGGL